MMSDSDEELDALIKRAVHKKTETQPADKGSAWRCAACTYANHKDLLECEICEKPRALTKNENRDLKSKLNTGERRQKVESKAKMTFGNYVLSDDDIQQLNVLGGSLHHYNFRWLGR